jgi:hypothetical protein
MFDHGRLCKSWCSAIMQQVENGIQYIYLYATDASQQFGIGPTFAQPCVVQLCMFYAQNPQKTYYFQYFLPVSTPNELQ